VEWLELSGVHDGGDEVDVPVRSGAGDPEDAFGHRHGELMPTGNRGWREVDEGVITRYPWIPGPWSYFSLHSPAETFAVVGDHSIKFA